MGCPFARLPESFITRGGRFARFSTATVSRRRILASGSITASWEIIWPRSKRFSRPMSTSRPSSATRRCGSLSGSRPSTTRAATTPCDATWASVASESERRSFRCRMIQGNASKRISDRFTSTFPTVAGPVQSWILVWLYSNYPFAVALPTQRTEAILEGMVRGFKYFGRVPREVWWDNPKSPLAVDAATEISPRAR